jgi:hypothetical protein
MVRSSDARDDQARLIGQYDGLGAVTKPELAEHTADVRLNRLLSHDEACGDLRVGQALRDEEEHFVLARVRASTVARSETGRERSFGELSDESARHPFSH